MINIKLVWILFAALSVLLTASCSKEVDNKPSIAKNVAQLAESRYVQIFTDPETNCQYITTMDGGITPRKAVNGSHFGCAYNK